MKRLFLITSLFLSSFIWGQTRYKLELTNLTFRINAVVKNSTTSNLTLTVIYDDNSTQEIFYTHIGGSGDNHTGWNLNPPLVLNKLPKTVHTTGFVNFRTGTDASYNQYNAIAMCSVNSYTVPSGTGRMSNITFSIKVTPVLDGALTQPIDNAFSTEDSTSIISNFKGFPSSVYNWQFSVNGGTTWLQFPSQYQGLDSIRLTAAQLFAGSGLNAVAYIGQNVIIRINACNGNSLSNSIILNIRNSPPNILSVNVTPPLCFDTDDGKVTFTFDRALQNGESLIVNLKDSTHPGLIYQRQITNDSLNANHAYTFPDNLQPALYYLVYQGAYVFTDENGNTGTSYSNTKQSDTFSVVAPTPVTFTSTSTNVWCYNGNDGTITINATGGAGNYQYMIKRNGNLDSTWYNFSTANQHIITGLTAGTWQFQIRDGNQCYAKTAAGGTVITQSVTITQPAAPLTNNLVKITNPLGYGLSNGSIEVEVSGGTPNAGGSYNFQWADINGNAITTGITANTTASGYRILLSNLPDGYYILNSNDNNYSSATAQQGCTGLDTFHVIQPPPLVVSMAIADSILCKNDANGSLVAHGTGGIPFTTGNPYVYTWKKKDASNNYQILPAQTDSVATGLSTGWYAVNIKDANGITLAQDSTIFLPEPTLLQVNITGLPVTCDGLANGSATATASGGSPGYKYAWSTGDSTATVDSLFAGTYFVFVKDRHQCQTQQNIVIAQPNAISLTVVKKQPTCYNDCDGLLTASITGGTAPYNYAWAGSSSTNNIASGLCGGNYQVTVTDANNCIVARRDTLINPQPLPVNLGKDRYLCYGQNIVYNITIPDSPHIIYQWGSNNGFSSNNAQVTLTQAGTYYASVTDNNGCNSKDTVTLTSTNTTISNEFALPTQAFPDEQIVVVNTSNPPADSIQWVLPAQAAIAQSNDNYTAFTLADTGVYYIKLITYRGDCYAEQTKKIIVAAPDNLNSIGATPTPFIQTFTVSPNPNNGNFNVRIVLQSKADIRLRLINIVSNQIISLMGQSGSSSYNLPVNVSVISGTYVLLLETPNGNASMKLIIL